jgi:hypothetical protein
MLHGLAGCGENEAISTTAQGVGTDRHRDEARRFAYRDVMRWLHLAVLLPIFLVSCGRVTDS